MKWPTTLILLAALCGSTVLAYSERLDGAAVTSIYGTIIGAVTVGHYVKTINGAMASRTEIVPPADGTTIIRERATVAPKEDEGP